MDCRNKRYPGTAPATIRTINKTDLCKVRVFFGGRDAGMSVDLSAAEMVAAEKDNIEESKKGVPSKTKQGRCAEQKKDVIEAL